ncbi:MAG: metalloregulator ArsR/SmtB family transcription factor [Patescibacteria group bacterium]
MDIYSALAEPTRRTIIEMLASQGELPASIIYDKFNVSSPAISQHLKILREANLVLMEKKAQQRIYKFNPVALLEVESWAGTMTQIWSERFDRLDDVIQSEQKKVLKFKNKKK